MHESLLQRTQELASAYLDSIATRPVAPIASNEQLIEALGGDLPEDGEPHLSVIERLATKADPGIVASAGGRFFGFVIGGTQPAALAADWLVSAWDQNAGFHVLSPAAAVIEQITASWILDLLQLPSESAVGFVTGCQMANFMALAAAREHMLQRVGWDAARRGLIESPKVRLITSAESHGTIDRALAMLGLGADQATRIPCDTQGRMRVSELESILPSGNEPTIVCAQAGNVDTGAFDDFATIGNLCRDHGAWLHIDGAFGLWAAASTRHRSLIAGVHLADSWATDAHKWLNVPYDSGLVIVRERSSLLAATNYKGAYLVREEAVIDPCMYTPESSRRARAIPLYAVLRSLGRKGIEGLVDRCCSHARRAADRFTECGATVLNDVVLNQVLVSFDVPDGVDPGDHMNSIVRRIRQDGTCWAGGTQWQGKHALRISVSGWRTTGNDIDRSVDAIMNCVSHCG